MVVCSSSSLFLTSSHSHLLSAWQVSLLGCTAIPVFTSHIPRPLLFLECPPLSAQSELSECTFSSYAIEWVSRFKSFYHVLHCPVLGLWVRLVQLTPTHFYWEVSPDSRLTYVLIFWAATALYLTANVSHTVLPSFLTGRQGLSQRASNKCLALKMQEGKIPNHNSGLLLLAA